MSLLTKIVPTKAFLMQAGMAGTLAMTGDVICQLAVEKAQKLDVHRSLRFGFVISCIAAPIQFKWFRFLEKHIRPSSTRLLTGTKKMLVDQAVAAPLLTGLMLFSVQFMESKSLDWSVARAKAIWPTVMISNYKVWPIVQLLNMSVIPLNFRIVFIQFIGMAWNCYISFMSQKKEEAAP